MVKKYGFTLLEVLLALMVLVSAVYIISNLQCRSLFKVLRERNDIEKTFRIKKELYFCLTNPLEENKKIVNKIENEEATFTSQLVNISSKSKLADMKKIIKIIRTDAQWKHNNAKHEASMVSFVYNPSKEQEKVS
jgi:prepilin-type N-terminal cleavage/methylation domain-containing protein